MSLLPSSSWAMSLRLYVDRVIRHQLARNLSWQMAGTLISSAFALGSSIGVARLLGREHFGEYGIVIGTVQTFAAFAAAGLGLTNTRYIARLRKSDAETASEIIGMSALVSCCAGVLLGGALHFACPVAGCAHAGRSASRALVERRRHRDRRKQH